MVTPNDVYLESALRYGNIVGLLSLPDVHMGTRGVPAPAKGRRPIRRMLCCIGGRERTHFCWLHHMFGDWNDSDNPADSRAAARSCTRFACGRSGEQCRPHCRCGQHGRMDSGRGAPPAAFFRLSGNLNAFIGTADAGCTLPLTSSFAKPSLPE